MAENVSVCNGPNGSSLNASGFQLLCDKESRPMYPRPVPPGSRSQNAPIRSRAGAPRAPPAADRGARRTCRRLNESGEREKTHPTCHRYKLCHSDMDAPSGNKYHPRKWARGTVCLPRCISADVHNHTTGYDGHTPTTGLVLSPPSKLCTRQIFVSRRR